MKILLITPNFFDYPKQICGEIRDMGHEVDWYDDRPSTNCFVKAAIRIKKDFVHVIIARYFRKIFKSIKQKKYDVVLLISGQSLSFSEGMIKKIKQSQPQAKFVLYQWDSVANFGYIVSLQKYFDQCYSFDRLDVANNPKLKFLPLFFTKRYEAIGNNNISSYKYDFMFVGTAHPKKYRYIKEMSADLKSVFKNQFIYFFFPSRIVFLYRKWKNSEFKKAKYSEFNFKPINGPRMTELLTQSNCVLDSAQAGQNGLTIRVFEALGAKRKIITTNADVVNYDFYRAENIYVYDGKFDLESPFFTKPYCELPKDVYEKYSLKNWLRLLLGS